MASSVEVMDLPPDPNNNAVEKSYSLRPRSAIKREEEDDDDSLCWRRRGRSKKRSKQKPAPLSKYRRKTANARERSRMREINEAFDTLRRAVPHICRESEKLTKISTLRLAMKYITALSEALANPDPLPHESDVESLLSDSTTLELSTSDSSATPPLPSLSVLDTQFADPYTDFSDSSLSLDPYADFAAFVLDDSFAPEFS